jgi:nicotinate-nucleotide pyrophosphorylase
VAAAVEEAVAAAKAEAEAAAAVAIEAARAEAGAAAAEESAAMLLDLMYLGTVSRSAGATLKYWHTLCCCSFWYVGRCAALQR